MATDAGVVVSANTVRSGATDVGETVHPQGSPCKVCGGLVEPGDKFCHACGAVQETASAAAPVVEQKHFRCQNCSAEIAVDPGQRSFTCPFCDSTYVVELPPTESGREPPEFVIGFAVTPQAAVEKFQAWLRQNGWFRPSDLRMAQIQDKMRGVYLPFWSFSMLAESRWSSQIGEYWYRTETYTVVEDGKTVTRTRQVQRNRMVESLRAAPQLLQRLSRLRQQGAAAGGRRANQAVSLRGAQALSALFPGWLA